MINDTVEFLMTITADIRQAGCHDISKLYLGRREWVEASPALVSDTLGGVRIEEAPDVESGIALIIEGIGGCAWERETC